MHIDSPPLSRIEQLRFAEQILHTYAAALSGLAARLDTAFCSAISMVHHCRGSVIATGMGKAGLIASKISATLASTGTRSHYLHPAEAIHGDLGRIGPEDVLLAFSQSGETSEIVRLLPSLEDLGAPVIAITCKAQSTLARGSQVVVDLGPLEEACPLGLAPSTSTVAMLAVGDALALVVSKMRGFRAEDFARFHPGGNLGLLLSRVEHFMRPVVNCRVASASHTIREVLVEQQRPGRRSGAIMLVDEQGRLIGLFTDSDLARLFERRQESALDRPVSEVMTHRPTTVRSGSRFKEAMHLLADCKFSELPVVDDEYRPVGMIDVTDVVGLAGPAEDNRSEDTRDNDAMIHDAGTTADRPSVAPPAAPAGKPFVRPPERKAS